MRKTENQECVKKVVMVMITSVEETKSACCQGRQWNRALRGQIIKIW